MTLYREKNNKLVIVKEKDNVLEKDIQKIVGENLYELMGLIFIEFEFQVDGKRIDILAFDNEMNAPVIIELKRNNDKGLFDQGMEYFNILLDKDKKHVFLTTFVQKLGKVSDIKSISWENSKVIFIGKNFTQRQKRAVDFKGIPVELWDYNIYENGLFMINQIGLDKKVNLDIKNSVGNNAVVKIKREFKTYDLDSHYQKGSSKTIEFFEKMKDEMYNIDQSFKEVYTGEYIAFKLNNKNLVNFYIQKSKIRVDLLGIKPGDLVDVEKKVYYREKSFDQFNQHISKFELEKYSEINYLVMLIKQCYSLFQNK